MSNDSNNLKTHANEILLFLLMKAPIPRPNLNMTVLLFPHTYATHKSTDSLPLVVLAGLVEFVFSTSAEISANRLIVQHWGRER